MGDPLLLVAVIGLGLSALASAIRLIDWFLHSDPKAIAQCRPLGRRGARDPVGAAVVRPAAHAKMDRRDIARRGDAPRLCVLWPAPGAKLLSATPRARLEPAQGSRSHTLIRYGANRPRIGSALDCRIGRVSAAHAPAFPNRTEPMEERSARSLPGAANPITATATTATPRPGRCPKRKLWISSALALMRRTRRSTTRIDGWRNWSIRTAAARIISP